MADERARNAPARPAWSGAGLAYAGTAYLLWGFLPLYFKLLERVSPLEIVLHRIVWSAPFLALALGGVAGWRAVGAAFARPRARWTLALSALVIGANWFIYVWAVHAEQVLQASLGYYLSPLVFVGLGAIVLRESISRAQWVAIALAGAGVLNQVIAIGQLPLVALALAGTFAAYGLLRKRLDVGARAGMFVEMAFLAPFALAAVVAFQATGRGHLFVDPVTGALLAFAGLVTVTPLLLFTIGARRLPLAMIGVLQFISPTIQFGVGLAFGEPFSPAHALTFVLIWAGAAAFVWDARRAG